MKKHQNQENRQKGYGSVIEHEVEMLAGQLERMAKELRDRNQASGVSAMLMEDLSIEFSYLETVDCEPEPLLRTTVTELVDAEIECYGASVEGDEAARFAALRDDLLNNAIKIDRCLSKEQQTLTPFT